MQGTGIGPALRKARLLRGKSIEEASRETRIRAEYLRALERERFQEMLGDVYVRGFLRSYSTYLGLDSGRVLTIYNRHFGGLRPTLPEAAAAPSRSPGHPYPHLAQLVRHHPSWTFLIGVALLLLGVFGAAGLLSRSRGAPSTEGAPGQRTVAPSPSLVTVVLKANEEVRAVIRIDGAPPQVFVLRQDEGRQFHGERSIDVQLEHGGTTSLTVNGTDLGTPGKDTSEFRATYQPPDEGGTSSPSP